MQPSTAPFPVLQYPYWGETPVGEQELTLVTAVPGTQAPEDPGAFPTGEQVTKCNALPSKHIP
jgi:hypothetical protein